MDGKGDDTQAQDRALEQGRLLFAQPCTFLRGALQPDQLPPPGLPEVAFAGRSNVGKSSLVNALTGRKTLARTSNTPGRTREINFFDLGGRLILVDLPGYGFAQAPKQAVQRWTRLARDYLKGRVTLRRVCLLIDARRGITAADRELMSALDEAAVSYQAVFTKADKPKPTELEAVLESARAELVRHVACHPDILVTSAVKGTGIAETRAALAMLATAAVLQ